MFTVRGLENRRQIQWLYTAFALYWLIDTVLGLRITFGQVVSLVAYNIGDGLAVKVVVLGQFVLRTIFKIVYNFPYR